MASSLSSFSADKRGYNAYLKSMGIDRNDQEAILVNAMSLSQFVTAVKSCPENKAEELNGRIEELNDRWFELLMAGQDDNNVEHDAYHIKHNLRRMVRELEKLEVD
jgi:hypothetical protein